MDKRIMKKVLLLPGWLTSLKLYKNNSNDFYVCLGKLDEEALSADYVIGISLGALVALRDVDKIKGKIILINPPLPKRSIFKWFIQWARFIKHEGLFFERQKFTANPIEFKLELLRCIKLLRVDFSDALDIYKDKLTVIRGKNDEFFCDKLAVDFLRSKGIKLIEVEGGHNWSEEAEKAMNNLIADL